MRGRFIALALLISAAPLAAEPWLEVAMLPGDIAVEIDTDSVFEALDGERLVLMATFRRAMNGAVMESEVAVDCTNKAAKIRHVRMTDDTGKVVADTMNLLADFAPVNEGSSEEIYFAALCEKSWENIGE